MFQQARQMMQRMWHNSLIQQVNGTMLLRVFFLGIGFLVRILLARALGADGLGVYNYAFAWIDILLLLTTFGVNRLVVRDVAAAIASENWGLVRGLYRFATVIPLLLSFVVGCMAFAAILYLQRSDSTIIPAAAITAMLLAILYLPIQTMVRIRQGAMQALDHVVKSQLPEYVVQPLLFIGLLVGWGLSPLALTPELAVALFVFSTLIALIYGEILHRRAIPPQAHTATPHYRVREWVLASLPLMFVSGLFVVNNRLDVLMLGSLADTAAVGVYVTASQLANLVTILLSSANTTLAPRFSRLHRVGDRAGLERLFATSTRMIFAGALLMATILYVFGIPVLAIFGREFVEGNTALRIMLVGQIVSAAAGSAASLLTMTNNSRYTATALSISTAINVIANLYLIPEYGANGAAFATALSLSIFNVLLSAFVVKQLAIPPALLGKVKKR